MIKNAESLADVYTQHSNEQTLEAFFVPQITIETSKLTHTK